MYVIMGATGHIGSALTRKLLQHKEPVTVIVRSEEKGQQWREQGAEIVVADVLDTKKLRQAFNKGKRLFVLNPPAPPHTDTVTEEKRTVQSILAALDGSDVEKVVAESTYGAQPGDGIGDLGVLYEMEQGIKKIGIPAIIIRGAYYMSNWDMSLETAQKEGVVYTLYPVDFKIPMVAPEDIGKLAAQLLKEPVEVTGLRYIEGPESYSAKDVAAAFEQALQKPVRAVGIPRSQWLQALTSAGFSSEAAESMAAMTELTLKGPDTPADAVRGNISLQEYINRLVQKVPSQASVLSTR
jgi:uncharacterized protein YbjT (DUF2867 family)